MLTTNLLFVNCGGAARTSNNASNNGTGNDSGDDGDVSLEDLSVLEGGARKFFRGTWTAPSGSVQEMIYAFKTPTLICIFSDTGFTNAASINSYVNQISDLDCFSKYN